MLKRKQNKKKKGFTLIELVIVLAVLAIIALIAIPNFTKVRNDSLKKADIESCNQIKKITLMSIANEDIKLTNSTQNIEIGFGTDKKGPANPTGISFTNDNYKAYLKDVKAPQYKSGLKYNVKIDNEGNVEVATDKLNIDGTDKQ